MKFDFANTPLYWCFILLFGLTFANGEEGQNEKAQIEFSVKSKHFNDSFQLEMSSGIAGSTVHYSTDGSPPRPNSPGTKSSLSPVKLIINDTQIIRAIATKDGNPITKESCGIYLLTDQIVHQFPLSKERGIETTAKVSQSLRAIPSLIILTEPEGILGAQSKPEMKETLAKIIWIDSKNSAQASCRIKSHGSGSLTESPKRGFRISFRNRFGTKTFNQKIFDTGEGHEFKELIVKSPTHDSWVVRDFNWRANSRYVNDHWTTLTLAELGNLTARRQWVHLYLNKAYWGLYAITERPDEHFAAALLKGKPERFVIYNGHELKSGDVTKWEDTKKLLWTEKIKNEERLREVEKRIELKQFIDYIIVNLYSNNIDWPRKNYWLIGRGIPKSKFIFISWDSEIGFFEKWDNILNTRNQSGLDYQHLLSQKFLLDQSGPGFVFRRLMKNSEFKIRFSDRIHQITAPEGTLGAKNAAARYRALLEEARAPLIAEAARWQKAIQITFPPSQDSNWIERTSEDSWLFTQFFPNRGNRLLESFKNSSWIPNLHLPPLKIVKNPESNLLILNYDSSSIDPEVSLIYTKDGEDPREQYSGKMKGEILPRGKKIQISPTEIPLKARLLKGKEWGPLGIFEL